MRNPFLYITTVVLSLLLSGCGASKSTTATQLASRTWTPDKVSPRARDYCRQQYTYPSFITLSGTAKYEYRKVSTDSEDEGLLGVAEEPKAIRHAQFEVLNDRTEVVQCGETDEHGKFTVQVPHDHKVYSLKIFSRADNSFNKVNVFIAPETNELYSIDYNFTANSDLSDIELTAKAKGDLKAGAFFILDQIHNVFDKLKVLTVGSPGLPISYVTSVADIYWAKGFNPAVYLGNPNTSISFYNKLSNKIFILGGDNGDVNFEDTDHFDSSIIIHEYYHFLEANVSKYSSPGGEHNGTTKLDSRLAWSEGAAQFFQAVINDFPAVIDTAGNIDGQTSLIFKVSVENESLTPGGSIFDEPEAAGDGAYREFAVARFLWDIYDTEPGTHVPNPPDDPESYDTVSNEFGLFWGAIANFNWSIGFNTPGFPYADLNHFIYVIDCNTNHDMTSFTTPWGLLLGRNKISLPGQYNPTISGWNFSTCSQN